MRMKCSNLTTRRNKVTQMTPPKGFMTGDEFERRVKERVTKFYKEKGLK